VTMAKPTVHNTIGPGSAEVRSPADLARVDRLAGIVLNAIALAYSREIACAGCGVYHHDDSPWPLYPAEITEPHNLQALTVSVRLCPLCNAELAKDTQALRRLFTH
jgi:hypothetical protein